MPQAARSELAIQTLFRSRARIQCPAVSIVAVPNAAKRGPAAVRQALREGMAAGFPDVMALAPGKVAFLEFKAKSGRLSANQAEWIQRLRRMGFPSGVFDEPDEAIAFLRWWGFPFLNGEAAHAL
jgi:hypothetical protein